MSPNGSPGSRFPVKPQTPAVEELLNTVRGILDRLADPADRLTGKGAQVKLKEHVGEYGARRYVEGKYGPNIKAEIKIPVRGTMGPEILDRGYELKNGRVVVIEAKYDQSTLGRTGRTVFEASEAGVERVVLKPNTVKQFSPEWFQDRITEIRKTNPRLANRLKRAWMAGEIEAIVVYVDPEGNVKSVEDHTEEYAKFEREGRPAGVTGEKTPAKPRSKTQRVSPEKATSSVETASEPRPLQGRSGTQPARESAAKASEALTSRGAQAQIEPAREQLSTGRPFAEDALPAAVKGTPRVGGARVSNFRILGSMAIDIVLQFWIGAAIGVLLDLILGDPNKNAIERALRQLEPEIKTRMAKEIKSPENIKRFEAAPFDQFWFEIRFHMIWSVDRAGVANSEVSREMIGTQLKLVKVVKWPRKSEIKIIAEEKDNYALLFRLNDIEVQECVIYQPVFKDLTQGEEMAARGIPLPKDPVSHGVTRKQWLDIAHDYIVFAKKFPELKAPYQKAWNRFKFELCAAGYDDLFTPQQIENCKDLKILYQRPEEKSETDDWRLRPIEIDRGTLNKSLNRRP
jgi:hypothetical protein